VSDKRPASYLTTYDFAKLNNACLPIREAFCHCVYLVGSVLTEESYRDVDVRVLLEDEKFDELFGGRIFIWSVVNLGIAAYLRDVTGLPIDFQIQRRTEANEKFSGMRNPIGTDARPYAGGGDATGLLK
jgi:hypothetical protein